MPPLGVAFGLRLTEFGGGLFALAAKASTNSSVAGSVDCNKEFRIGIGAAVSD